MGDRARQIRLSKTISYWLRHAPLAGGLTLDREGWTDVDALLSALSRETRSTVSLEELEALVAGSEKQRFSLRNGRIRANQGHSIGLTLDFQPVEPPATLFHGTTAERWQRISATGGLAKMQRHHVHLSPDEATARHVAGRHHGEHPLILRVNSAAMRAAGHEFFISENGVYLTELVPLAFLTPLAQHPRP